MVKTDMIQGEMVLLHNLADPTNNIGDISFILSEDHILMAFPASDLMSRNSMIQRGDIVDIFATFDEEVETVGDTLRQLMKKMSLRRGPSRLTPCSGSALQPLWWK